MEELKEKLYKIFKLISECGFYGLLLFLPISISILVSFAGVMILGFVGRKIIKPDFKYLNSWPNICLYVFLFFSALSMINSGVYFNKSLHALFSKWVQYVAICVVVQDVACKGRVFERGMAMFLFGALLTVLSGLSQCLFGIEFLRGRAMAYTDSGLRATTASFSNYNSFGGYLVAVLSFVLSQLLIPKMRRLKAYSLLILAVISVVAIFLTFSRGSWMAFAASFALIIILSGNRFMQLFPVIFEIVYTLSFPIFRERLSFIFKIGGDCDRFEYWRGAWRMIVDHPFFGQGVGTFMDNFIKYISRHAPLICFASYAHNCYLQIWAETGIFSLASFLAFAGWLIYFGFKKFFESQDFLLLGLMIGLVGYLVHSFFEVHLYSLQLAVLFWVWAGLIIARLRVPNGADCY